MNAAEDLGPEGAEAMAMLAEARHLARITEGATRDECRALEQELVAMLTAAGVAPELLQEAPPTRAS